MTTKHVPEGDRDAVTGSNDPSSSSNHPLERLRERSVSWIKWSPNGVVVRPPASNLAGMLGMGSALGAIPSFVCLVAVALMALFFVGTPTGFFDWASQLQWANLLDAWWLPGGVVLMVGSEAARRRWLPSAVLDVGEHEIRVSGVRGVRRLPLADVASVTPTTMGWSINRVQGPPVRLATSAGLEDSRFVFRELERLAERARTAPLASPPSPTVAGAWESLAARELGWVESEVDEVLLQPAPRTAVLWTVASVVLMTSFALLASLLFIAVGVELSRGFGPGAWDLFMGSLTGLKMCGFLFLFEFVRQRFTSPANVRVRAHEIEIERAGSTQRMALRDLTTIERSARGWRLTSQDGTSLQVPTSDHSEDATAVFRWLRLLAEQARAQGTSEEVPAALDVLKGRTQPPRQSTTNA
jgi:hypothetical protein